MKTYKTYQPKKKEIVRVWHLIDAKNQVLGRLSTDIASKLTGKYKPSYSEHMDSGDYVVVINAKDIKLTGNKENQKVYISHSGYPGGYKEVKYAQMHSEKPSRVIENAVWGMLPENRLKKKRFVRLKVFDSSEHTFKDKFTKSESK